jgi:hypothetical protein
MDPTSLTAGCIANSRAALLLLSSRRFVHAVDRPHRSSSCDLASAVSTPVVLGRRHAAQIEAERRRRSAPRLASGVYRQQNDLAWMRCLSGLLIIREIVFCGWRWHIGGSHAGGCNPRLGGPSDRRSSEGKIIACSHNAAILPSPCN